MTGIASHTGEGSGQRMSAVRMSPENVPRIRWTPREIRPGSSAAASGTAAEAIAQYA